jgi:hypothetical protein
MNTRRHIYDTPTPAPAGRPYIVSLFEHQEFF